VGPGFDVIYGLTVYDLRYYFDRKTVMTMLWWNDGINDGM
jgi:hypothetical protein